MHHSSALFGIGIPSDYILYHELVMTSKVIFLIHTCLFIFLYTYIHI